MSLYEERLEKKKKIYEKEIRRINDRKEENREFRRAFVNEV